MARVYLAEDPQMERTVFLKLIDAATDEDGREVIEAERRGAALQDQLARREPGGRVAQIYEINDLEGYFFIAMEYVEGEDLSEIIRRGPIEPGRAVEIAQDVLAVLARAHLFQAWVQDREYRGIIHGDIKPRNIRITRSGQVKLLDFGIAKAISATRGKTHNYFASARYSSPQRLESGEVDAPADLWSVAAVLFEMLTSKPYFPETEVPRLEAAIRKYDSLKQTVMLVPGGLREVLRKALDPNPQKRFQTASEFQAALKEGREGVFGAGGSPADPEATRRTVPDAEATRKSVWTPSGVKPAAPGVRAGGWKWRMPTGAEALRLKAGTAVAVFLVLVFGVVYEIRMWRNADTLRARIDSRQISLEDAEKARLALEKQARLPAPLYPARNALRDRYVAEAERVIGNYRSFSPGAAVGKSDWLHAKAMLARAVRIAPDDKGIRAAAEIVEGHLKVRASDLKGALSEFEDARGLAGNSPDPHLGLALVHLMTGELDRAEDEYGQAAKYGFRPGRLQQQTLAEAYRRRGERWAAGARRAHDSEKALDAYRHADSDLEKAQGLYSATAPYGLAQAEKIGEERRDVQGKMAGMAVAVPAGNPQ